MKNKKKLSTLKVKSFVTTLDGQTEQTVQGGKPIPTPPVTGGILSICCSGVIYC